MIEAGAILVGSIFLGFLFGVGVGARFDPDLKFRCRLGRHKWLNGGGGSEPAWRKCKLCRKHQELLPGGGDFDWVDTDDPGNHVDPLTEQEEPI